ncbi:hypothetical protein BJX99DRAFT_67318 [Aspergillus californicus]
MALAYTSPIRLSSIESFEALAWYHIIRANHIDEVLQPTTPDVDRGQPHFYSQSGSYCDCAPTAEREDGRDSYVEGFYIPDGPDDWRELASRIDVLRKNLAHITHMGSRSRILSRQFGGFRCYWDRRRCRALTISIVEDRTSAQPMKP